MAEILKKLTSLLDASDRRRAYPVFALALVMAMVETLGVASIMPFMALLSNPEIIEKNRYLAAAYRQLGFESTNSFLIALGSATLVLLVGSVVLRALTVWVQLRFINIQTHIVATRMVSSYLRQPYEWFLRQNSSSIGSNVLNEVSSAFQGVAFPLMLLFVNGIVAFLLISLLVAVDPLLAMTSTAVLGGVYLTLFLLGRKFTARMGAMRVKANRGRHQALYEAFGGIKDIKVTGTESSFIARFRFHSERTARAAVSVALVAEIPAFVMQAVVFGGMLLSILYLIMSRGSLQQALPVLSLYAVAGYRLLPTLQNAYKNVVTLRYHRPALDALYRDAMQFKHGTSDGTPNCDEVPGGEPINLRRALELHGINFRYAGSDKLALRNLNLTVPAHSTIALVGSTGSGKTTAVDVILGLLQPSEGRLFVDGLPLTPRNIRAWQRIIGYVPQSIFLSDDTVAANIAFGVPPEEIDRSAIERAGRIASLHDFVSNELPNGYDTPIGERGIRLSGGQRQRIGIARALYHDPEVLILDEASSALDNVTEQAVMDAIYHLGRRKTIIMIAHRLSTVRDCDRIFVLDRGRVIDAGRYDELLVSSDTFRALALQDSDDSSHPSRSTDEPRDPTLARATSDSP